MKTRMSENGSLKSWALFSVLPFASVCTDVFYFITFCRILQVLLSQKNIAALHVLKYVLQNRGHIKRDCRSNPFVCRIFGRRSTLLHLSGFPLVVPSACGRYEIYHLKQHILLYINYITNIPICQAFL